MTYTELQTVEAHGIPRIEYCHEPELRNQLDNTIYITSVKDKNPEKPRNRYLVTLCNILTGKEQRVDLVIQEDGFIPIMNAIRSYFGSAWELFTWQDCDAPF